MLHGFGKLTNDSASYLFSALQYAKNTENYFPPDREFGYRTFILLISWLSPWKTTQKLVNYVTLVQIGLFLFLGLAWTIADYRLIEPWPATLIPLSVSLLPRPRCARNCRGARAHRGNQG